MSQTLIERAIQIVDAHIAEANKMSFLKKLGGILAGVAGVMGMAAPVVKVLIPGSKDDQLIDAAQDVWLPKASELIVNTEAFGQALNIPGPQKLQAASGPMASLLLTSSIFAGKKIKDPEKFKGGATKIADGLADCWNAVDGNDVKL